MVAFITVIILWWVFASVHGWYDAEMYHMKDYDRPISYNPHRTATILRAIVCVGLLYPWLYSEPLSIVLKMVGAFILSFSFWHNGWYFVRRRMLGVTDHNYTFFGHSSTTATFSIVIAGHRIHPFEYGGIQRSILFAFSLLFTYLCSVHLKP